MIWFPTVSSTETEYTCCGQTPNYLVWLRHPLSMISEGKQFPSALTPKLDANTSFLPVYRLAVDREDSLQRVRRSPPMYARLASSYCAERSIVIGTVHPAGPSHGIRRHVPCSNRLRPCCGRSTVTALPTLNGSVRIFYIGL